MWGLNRTPLTIAAGALPMSWSRYSASNASWPSIPGRSKIKIPALMAGSDGVRMDAPGIASIPVRSRAMIARSRVHHDQARPNRKLFSDLPPERLFPRGFLCGRTQPVSAERSQCGALSQTFEHVPPGQDPRVAQVRFSFLVMHFLQSPDPEFRILMPRDTRRRARRSQLVALP